MKTILLLLSLFCCCAVYSQKSVYADKCTLIKDLLDTANKTAFNFKQMAKDSVITLLDINDLLTPCSINRVESVKINVINSGPEIENIKKDGVLRASKKESFFILTYVPQDTLLGFSVFYPVSNTVYYWVAALRNKQFYIIKKGGGDF